MTEIMRTAFHNLLKSLPGSAKFDDVARTLYAFSRVHIPRYLYRYRSCGEKHSFDDIEKEQITLSSASQFDDLDDTSIHDMGELDRFAEIISSQKDISLQILQEMASKVSARDSEREWTQLTAFINEFYNRPEEERKENLSILKEQVRTTIDLEKCNAHLRSHQKIACFCENRDSDYMWETYAGNGSGYLIEYDSSTLYSIDTLHNRIPHVLPVVYCNKPVDTFILPILSGISDMATMMLDKEKLNEYLAICLITTIFYKQSDPYAKEEEWRLMLTPLDSEIEDEFIFRRLKPFRIIAGPNMEAKNKKRLYDCAKNNCIMIIEHEEWLDNVVRHVSN